MPGLRFFLFLAFILPGLSTAKAQDDDAKLPKIEFSKWSGSVNVPDPVAISFDNRGRAYVTQTQRRKAQDLDIRNNRDWVPDDVGFQTVDEKRAFYHEQLAPGKKGNEKRVADLNKDGSHDYLDLMMISEKIHLIEDTDGDGTADRIQLYAEDFKSEVTGIAAGVLWHNGDVYSTIAPDVFRLTDSDDDGVADKRTTIATGFGLHIAYAGHDMHGLAVGPDGKIYWSIGDKGISVKTAEGKKFRYPNQGGVMRCNPDGSDFEVFAHGLRNVQEFAFDKYGNMFGVDNDSDQQDERERVVYIVRGMDAGWRCSYQYRKGGYNPWMAEKLWVPHFEGQAAYIVPPIKHSINGPAGFAYNPGSALSDSYRDYFFLTGAPNGNQIAFRMVPQADSFRVANEHEIGNGIPLVGINFAPDGGLYGVDWGGGYPLNQKGAVWKMDVAPEFRSQGRDDVQKLLARDITKVSEELLASQLAHPDQRIRLQAQFELVARLNVKLLCDVASRESDNSDSQLLPRIHALWGVSQLSESGDCLALGGGNILALKTLTKALSDSNDEIRAQAAKLAYDHTEFDGELLIPLLDEYRKKDGGSVRVAFFAAQALAKHGTKKAVGPLVEAASRVVASDRYMRHAISMALAGCANGNRLRKLHSHPSKLVRLCAVVAMRERKLAGVAEFLADGDEDVATEAARAIYDDFSIPKALPILAAALPETNYRNDALVQRMIGANVRLADPKGPIRLARFAANSEEKKEHREASLNALAEWVQPNVLDVVDGRNRRVPKHKRDFDRKAIVPFLSSLVSSRNDSKIQAAAMRAAGNLEIPLETKTLEELARADSTSTDLRLESLHALAKRNEVGSVVHELITSSNRPVRMRALELMVKTDPPNAFARVEKILDSDSRSSMEKQAAMLLLGRLETSAADARLSNEIEQLAANKASADLQLEIYEAAKQRSAQVTDFGDRLNQIDAERASQSKQDPIAAYKDCLTGGDKSAGKDVFMNHLAAQCIRCHKLGKKGSTVGPALDDVGKRRDAKYLLRAIISPSADIEPKYRSQIVVLDSGKTVTGLPKRKTEKEIVLVDNSGKEIRIPTDSIDEIDEQNISIMPEMKQHLTHREIRDLVAYLGTLKKKK